MTKYYLSHRDRGKKATSPTVQFIQTTPENSGFMNIDRISGLHLCCSTDPRSWQGYDGGVPEGICEAMSMLDQVTERCSEYRMLLVLQISSRICQGILDKAVQEIKNSALDFFLLTSREDTSL